MIDSEDKTVDNKNPVSHYTNVIEIFNVMIGPRSQYGPNIKHLTRKTAERD